MNATTTARSATARRTRTRTRTRTASGIQTRARTHRHPRTRPYRVLLLSASAGNGHVRAARALEQALEREGIKRVGSGKRAVEIRRVDMLEMMPLWLRVASRDAYEALIDHAPGLWGKLYHAQNRRWTRKHGPLRRVTNRHVGERLFDAIAQYEPDLIVGTHFLHLELLRGNEHRIPLGCRMAMVVTDNAAHRVWRSDSVDGYYVFSEEVAEEFARRGVPRERLLATGMPIESKFYGEVDRPAALGAMGFDADRPTVALVKGMARWAWLHRESAVERLLATLKDANVLIIVGKGEEKLARRLRRRGASHPHLRVETFVSNMEEVLGVADVVVCKPGGSMTAELLAKKVPAVLMGAIPGQEEKNRDLLVNGGMALEAREFKELAGALGELVSDPQQLDDMRRRYDGVRFSDPATRIALRELDELDRRLSTGKTRGTRVA